MKRVLCRLLALCILPLLLSMVDGLVVTTLASRTSLAAPTASVYLPLVRTSQLTKTYLPVVLNGAPSVSNFGVHPVAPKTYNDRLAPLNVGWLRLVGPSWSEVEAKEGRGYNWNVPSVKHIETALARLKQDGLYPRVILMSLGSPAWSTVDGSICGPIKPEHYDDYARFMEAAVKRFGTIHYWELGNEPDVDVEDVGPKSGFGCWGDKDDEFYGGRAYGEMLKVVYPAIKRASASAQVVHGGLLLFRPYDPVTKLNLSARFLEGVFVAGAGSSFDIANYHAYTYYTSPESSPDGASAIGSGAIDWKVRYLRGLMRRYGVPEKPFVMTETALLCYVDATKRQACHNAQANNVGRLYARAARDRVLAATWYLFASDGFHYTSFFNPITGELRPVYHAFKHASVMFGGATFLGALADQENGVEGYRFKNGRLAVTIFWSDQSGKTATIPVPPGSTPRCTRRDGTPLPCQNTNGVVHLPATSESTYIAVP